MELTDFLRRPFKLGDIAVFSKRKVLHVGQAIRYTDAGNLVFKVIAMHNGNVGNNPLEWKKHTEYAPLDSCCKIEPTNEIKELLNRK